VGTPGRIGEVLIECRLDPLRARRSAYSHVLTSMLGAEALAIVPADADPPSAGDTVELELLPADWGLGSLR
jgi:molybdopterin biosynthesis enzyme